MFCAAKVTNFKLFILSIGYVYQNVFGFDVSVCDAEFVKTRKS